MRLRLSLSFPLNSDVKTGCAVPGLILESIPQEVVAGLFFEYIADEAAQAVFSFLILIGLIAVSEAEAQRPFIGFGNQHR